MTKFSFLRVSPSGFSNLGLGGCRRRREETPTSYLGPSINDDDDAAALKACLPAHILAHFLTFGSELSIPCEMFNGLEEVPQDPSLLSPGHDSQGSPEETTQSHEGPGHSSLWDGDSQPEHYTMRKTAVSLLLQQGKQGENEEHNSSLPPPPQIIINASLPLCPLIPPGLHGPIKVELDNRLYPQVLPGGTYRPLNCSSRHRVALIVPYRDRETHLSIFLYNIHHLLLKQQLDYAIFIVEQAGSGPFNRAMLFNAYDFQCFVFHDIDLLPEDDRNLYNCPLHPRHMSVAINVFMYRLPYTDIFGGVSAMSDDDMFNRIRHRKLFISRYPSNVGRYKMLKHAKDAPNPERFKMLFSGVKRIDSDGFNSLKYKVLKMERYKLYTWILADLSK
ncbi:Putative glucosylceramide beta-14-galactosyltransferase [Caligus rogercresseyi]|uniref:Beta-1,4-N-acetylgalactosaminyltransferase n=1 Tax=Caligus rogercresseyi TaxID=217165 RepID=A0A7T8GZI3_CALRO|nr:Putative glucosylceramide beta-14-galactosyltransferase [Caligus rogercresseyi]